MLINGSLHAALNGVESGGANVRPRMHISSILLGGVAVFTALTANAVSNQRVQYSSASQVTAKAVVRRPVVRPVVTPTSYPVSVTVTGSGSITSNPAGIDCGQTCSHSFSSGTSVTFTATPANGSQFTGWSGVCAGTTASCTTKVTASTQVGATFTVAGDPGATTLSARYPGDVGMASDTSVIWTENFEQGSVSALTSRYSSVKSTGLSLSTDVPAGSRGRASGKFFASASGPNATDLFKSFSQGYDEVYVRYYAKYDAGTTWHHSGVWIGGYNPPSRFPNPQAGSKPNGDERFSISLESMGTVGSKLKLDFYNYWMKMHSWMATPSGSGAYYGNTLIHKDEVAIANGQWVCMEYHVKLNPDPTSGKGAELEAWVNDSRIASFTDTNTVGYWVRDKFCPDDATSADCTKYRPANATLVPLDQQYRSTSALKINHFWPQNYITEGTAGNLYFDDMVVATSRIGCMK